MEQVDLIWGKARVKALIRVLTPSLVNLRLGTCQFSILGCEMILVYGHANGLCPEERQPSHVWKVGSPFAS